MQGAGNSTHPGSPRPRTGLVAAAAALSPAHSVALCSPGPGRRLPRQQGGGTATRLDPRAPPQPPALRGHIPSGRPSPAEGPRPLYRGRRGGCRPRPEAGRGRAEAEPLRGRAGAALPELPVVSLLLQAGPARLRHGGPIPRCAGAAGRREAARGGGDGAGVRGGLGGATGGGPAPHGGPASKPAGENAAVGTGGLPCPAGGSREAPSAAQLKRKCVLTERAGVSCVRVLLSRKSFRIGSVQITPKR